MSRCRNPITPLVEQGLRLHARVLGFSARLNSKHHPPPASSTPRPLDPDGEAPF